MKVILIKKFNPTGRREYVAGESYEVREGEADILVKLGIAKLEEKESKRKYQRRDMQAAS